MTRCTSTSFCICPLRPCRSLARIRPHVCLNHLHDSRVRHSLFAPLGGDRTGCRQAGPYREGFCGGRSKLTAADRHRHGLCDLVRRRSRARDFGHICEGRVTRRRRRSLWVEPLFDSGWIVLCPPVLSAEPPDRRRLLSSPVQPRVEVLCAVCIAASYLGWVAAQFKVFGLC